MAQSVEHRLGKAEVPGSSPGNSSKEIPRKAVFVLWVMSDHRLGKAEVPGSSPGNSSNRHKRALSKRSFCVLASGV